MPVLDISMPFIIAPILAFITVAMFAFALAAPQTSPLQERLKAYGYDLNTYSGGDLTQPFSQRVIAPLGGWFMRLIQGLTPANLQAEASARIKQAGNPMSVNTFLILRFVVMLGLPATALIPPFLSGNVSLLNIIVAVVLLFMGGRLPNIWLSFRIDGRRDRMRRALPDALDLITVCVEAGYSLEAALAKVTERTSGPLSEELRYSLAEIQLGKPRRDALRDLSERADLAELQSFIAAILQADQMGVSIAQVLRVQAGAIRVRRRQRAEEQAAKAPVKMLFPLMLLIFPTLMLVVLGPAMIKALGFFGQMSS